MRVGQLAFPVGGALGLGEAGPLNLPSGVGLPDRAGDVPESVAPRVQKSSTTITRPGSPPMGEARYTPSTVASRSAAEARPLILGCRSFVT